MSGNLATLACVACVLFLAGCGVQSTTQEVRQAQTDLGDHSIVILSRKHKTQGETEDEFVNCVSGNVNKGDDALPVLAEQEFVDATFPWFEPRTAPLTMDDLSNVINRAAAHRTHSRNRRALSSLDRGHHATFRRERAACNVRS